MAKTCMSSRERSNTCSTKQTHIGVHMRPQLEERDTLRCVVRVLTRRRPQDSVDTHNTAYEMISILNQVNPQTNPVHQAPQPYPTGEALPVAQMTSDDTTYRFSKGRTVSSMRHREFANTCSETWRTEIRMKVAGNFRYAKLCSWLCLSAGLTWSEFDRIGPVVGNVRDCVDNVDIF